MRVLYRPAALDDLEQIYDFTFEMWGPAQAENYLAQLRSAAERLLVHPRSGRVYEMEGPEVPLTSQRTSPDLLPD